METTISSWRLGGTVRQRLCRPPCRCAATARAGAAPRSPASRLSLPGPALRHSAQTPSRAQARRIEQRQHAEKLPCAIAIGPRNAQRTKTSRRKFADRFFYFGLHLRGIGRQLQYCRRSALRHLKGLPISSLEGGLGTLVHRVEGLEVRDAVAVQLLPSLHTAEHREIERVLVFGARRQHGAEDGPFGGDAVHAFSSPKFLVAKGNHPIGPFLTTI